MRTRGTDAIPLAPRPNLEQYRRQAKDLLRAARAGDREAVHAWASRWIEHLARLMSKTATPEYVDRTSGQLDRRAIDGQIASVVEDAGRARLLGDGAHPATLSDAQYFVAWLHGFESWPKFVRHIEARQLNSSPVSQFEAAADAVVTGDTVGLARMIARNSQLTRARSTRDHHATLLHYVAANGHESFRQVTPKNAVAVARLLLEAGAEADALADMYSYRCTTMEMVVSSAHPHAAGVQSALVEILLDFGAAVDGVGGDGSPIMTALAFDYPLAAETLAARGAAIDNVIAAAVLNRLDLLERFVADDGSLRPDAHLVRVPWPKLPQDPKTHLAYALTWAAKFGRREAVALLLRKGLDPDSHDRDATALHFAAAHGHLDIVRLLLDRGASLEMRNNYGGTVLGGTLWYAHEAPRPGVDYATVVRSLIAAGARTDVYPGMRESLDAVLSEQRSAPPKSDR